MIDKYIVKPGSDLKLCNFPTIDGENFTKKDIKKMLKTNIKNILSLQEKLYAESKQSLLVVLQAIDAGGKDSTIRKVFGKVNPQGCRVHSFKKPNEREQKQDFLWRIHQKTPRHGMINIFNRSHYEDVLVVAVHNLIDDTTCQRRIQHIINFEKLLIDSNTQIIKIFLHLSKDEQKRRFEKRLSNKEKHWKFSSSDLKERQYWDAYQKQFEYVLSATSTENAPWYIIPADFKPYRSVIVSSIVAETLQKMNPVFPPPEEGLDKIIIK